MVIFFSNNEEEYLEWCKANVNGLFLTMQEVPLGMSFIEWIAGILMYRLEQEHTPRDILSIVQQTK